MTEDLWRLVRDGSKPVATHAVYAATTKYSPLFGDFLDLVVRDLYRRFEDTLKPQHWERYLEDCHNRDPAMPEWSAGTLESLRIESLRHDDRVRLPLGFANPDTQIPFVCPQR